MPQEHYEDIHRINENLETTTMDLDRSFHKLLEGETNVEAELKKELQEDEELIEITNKGIHVVDQLEKLEKKIEQHERAAEQGQSHNEMKEILGHDLEELNSDLLTIRKILRSLREKLEQFEQESDSTSQEIHTFEDTVTHISEGLGSIEEFKERVNELYKGEYKD